MKKTFQTRIQNLMQNYKIIFRPFNFISKKILTIFCHKHTKNEVRTLTSEHLSSGYSFKIKLQVNRSPYNQTFEKREEELIGLKGKQHTESNMLSSETH